MKDSPYGFPKGSKDVELGKRPAYLQKVHSSFSVTVVEQPLLKYDPNGHNLPAIPVLYKQFEMFTGSVNSFQVGEGSGTSNFIMQEMKVVTLSMVYDRQKLVFFTPW